MSEIQMRVNWNKHQENWNKFVYSNFLVEKKERMYEEKNEAIIL